MKHEMIRNEVLEGRFGSETST